MDKPSFWNDCIDESLAASTSAHLDGRLHSRLLPFSRHMPDQTHSTCLLHNTCNHRHESQPPTRSRGHTSLMACPKGQGLSTADSLLSSCLNKRTKRKEVTSVLGPLELGKGSKRSSPAMLTNKAHVSMPESVWSDLI